MLETLHLFEIVSTHGHTTGEKLKNADRKDSVATSLLNWIALFPNASLHKHPVDETGSTLAMLDTGDHTGIHSPA